MSSKKEEATRPAEKTSPCGCAQTPSGHGCPCAKRACLPVLGIIGIVVLVSLTAKKRKSR